MADKGVFRIKDWWWSKASMLMGMVYIFVLWFHIPFDRFLLLALLSIATICGFASMGYLVNDLFDIKKDALAGKANFMENKHPLASFSFFILSSLLIFAPWYMLPADRYSYLLIATELCCFVIYSIPPIRLKERGMAGIITDAIYAHALPVILACYTFSLAAHVHPSAMSLGLLCCWQSTCGIRNILIHQADDMAADRVSSSQSYVMTMGYDWFITAVIPLMVVELLFCALFFISLSYFSFAFLFFFALLFVYSNYVYSQYIDRPVDLLTGKWKYYPNLLNEKRFPYLAICILSCHDLRFAIVLIAHALLFDLSTVISVSTGIWDRVTLFIQMAFSKCRTLMSEFLSFMTFILVGILWSRFKLAVNYMIYIFFKLCGVDLIKEKKTVLQYLKYKRQSR